MAQAAEEKKSDKSPYGVDIIPLPTSENNYAHIIIDHASSQCMLTDPSSGQSAISKILSRWSQLKATNDKLQLVGILATHKHWDHVGGIGAMKNKFKDIKVYGSKIDNRGLKNSSNCFTNEVDDGEIIPLGNDTQVKVIATPCHTLGHVVYYVTDTNGKYPSCFTGDTLFRGGVGRFFEGTAKQMLDNFNKIRNLPKDCKLYNGHEYTKDNYDFGALVEPNNEKIKQFRGIAKQKRYDLCNPSTVQDEIDANVFMRTSVDSVRHNLATIWKQRGMNVKQKFDDESDVMAALRQLKNKGFHRL